MYRFYSVLITIGRKMGKYRITRLFHRILFKVGLIRLVYYLFVLWFHKHPTQKMKAERQFFSDHAQELKMVYDCLEDDRSKNVFENILKYRVTSDLKFLRKSVGEDSEKTQYFVPELQFSDHEIIVDCGACNGDTTKLFYENIPGCKVIALEPSEDNFELLQKLALPGLKCIKAGAWSEDTTLSFSGRGTTGTIDASGNTKIDVRALDHLPECQSATYIKMDIEGAEMEALKGAEKIISTPRGGGGRPKLAICIYHKPQDFFEIPLYIKKLNPDYKLFVHQHYYYLYHAIETVLYAL